VKKFFPIAQTDCAERFAPTGPNKWFGLVRSPLIRTLSKLVDAHNIVNIFSVPLWRNEKAKNVCKKLQVTGYMLIVGARARFSHNVVLVEASSCSINQHENAPKIKTSLASKIIWKLPQFRYYVITWRNPTKRSKHRMDISVISALAIKQNRKRCKLEFSVYSCSTMPFDRSAAKITGVARPTNDQHL